MGALNYLFFDLGGFYAFGVYPELLFILIFFLSRPHVMKVTFGSDGIGPLLCRIGEKVVNFILEMILTSVMN